MLTFSRFQILEQEINHLRQQMRLVMESVNTLRDANTASLAPTMPASFSV
jgi:hypothetical protein